MDGQRLAGKRAVITGGSSGFGLAMAKLFVEHGARVVITGRDEPRLQQAAATLGPIATAVHGDVARLDDLAHLAQRTQDILGGVDVLVANAGIGHFAPLAQLTEADFQRVFDVNVKGVLFTVQRLQPLLADGASVILIASAAHAKGSPTGSVYAASKAAVRSFARCLAVELGPRVRVNALSPGGVATRFQERLNNPDHLRRMAATFEERTPLKRLGQADEVAAAALFLASDDSAFMTGADLVVDGGFMNV